MRGGGWLVLVGLLGLGVYAGLQQWPQIQARFGVSPSETLPAGAPAPAVVYRWKDAQGNVHFGDRPNEPGAKRVELAPLNTMKGMSRAEVDSASNRHRPQPPKTTLAHRKMPIACAGKRPHAIWLLNAWRPLFRVDLALCPYLALACVPRYRSYVVEDKPCEDEP